MAPDLRYICLSDLHLGSLLGRPWLEARIDQVRAERPDLVVLLGDLHEGHGGPPQEELVPAWRRLVAPLGVWAVLGNHEFHRRRGPTTSPMQDAGVRLLRNSWVEVRPGLVLAGVDDLRVGVHRAEGGEFAQQGRVHVLALDRDHVGLAQGAI